MKIHVNEQGKVIVTTPPFTPGFFIKRFVDTSKEWIEKNIQSIEDQKRKKDGSMLFLGEKYNLIVEEKKPRKEAVEVLDQEIVVRPVSSSSESQQRTIERWLKSQAEQYVVRKVHELSKKMSLNFQSISLRDQKSRWGSCSAAKRLQFNWRLIQAPEEVIEYVIIHELSHLQEMNHSKKFWLLVERYDKEYALHRAWLRRHGKELRS